MIRVPRAPTLAAGALAGALALVLLAPLAARAQSKVQFEVLVSQVSMSGAKVDEALKPMAQAFKANGLAFTFFQLVGRHTAELAPGQSLPISLPGGGKADVAVLKDEGKGKFRFKVTTPGSTSEYSMGPKGEVYIEAGGQLGGKIFMLLRR